MFYIFTCKWFPQHHLFENGVFYSCIALPFLINQVTGFVGLSTCCILGLGESLLRAIMFPRSGPIGMPDRSAFAETSLHFLSSFHGVQMTHLTCRKCWLLREGCIVIGRDRLVVLWCLHSGVVMSEHKLLVSTHVFY